jgi:hypothetical protein
MPRPHGKQAAGRISAMRTAIITAMSLLFTGCALAQQTQSVRYTCTPADGRPFALTIDTAAKTVDVGTTSLPPALDDSVEITDKTVEWGVMRGYFILERQSGKLVWDMGAEYDYLAAIGQPSEQPRESFAGSAQCASAQ